jgi:ribosomal protein L17
MKKFFHFAAIALVGTALTVACNNNNSAEDSTAVDSTTVDSLALEVEDTVAVVDSIVPEQPTQTTSPKAKATEKKAEKTLTATEEKPTVDAKTNAQNRMAKKEAEKKNLKEAETTKENNASVPDLKKNAANRLRK